MRWGCSGCMCPVLHAAWADADNMHHTYRTWSRHATTALALQPNDFILRPRDVAMNTGCSQTVSSSIAQVFYSCWNEFGLWLSCSSAARQPLHRQLFVCLFFLIFKARFCWPYKHFDGMWWDISGSPYWNILKLAQTFSLTSGWTDYI